MKTTSIKKWVILAAMVVLAFASLSVNATTTYRTGTKSKLYKKSFYAVDFDGKLVTNDSAPGIMLNDNVLVPYNTVFTPHVSGLKATYKWQKKRLILTYKGSTYKLYIGKKYMHANGKKKKLNTAPVIANVNGNEFVMVPAKAICNILGLGYTYVKAQKKVFISTPSTQPVAASNVQTTLTAKQLSSLTTTQFIQVMGPLANADNKKTGVLASVTLAQCINESGWGKTTLAQQGNNVFGMKISLSGNTWGGSTWDGVSYVTINTKEEVKGKKVTVSCKFRKYANVGLSISDHSAYLINAKNGSSNRYAGLALTKSYATQLSILQKGGYCTWSSYVKELTNLIKKYNLTAYDVQ